MIFPELLPAGFAQILPHAWPPVVFSGDRGRTIIHVQGGVSRPLTYFRMESSRSPSIRSKWLTLLVRRVRLRQRQVAAIRRSKSPIILPVNCRNFTISRAPDRSIGKYPGPLPLQGIGRETCRGWFHFSPDLGSKILLRRVRLKT